MATSNGTRPQRVTKNDLTLMRNELQEFSGLVNNVILSRAAMLDKLLDERRDIDKECGYQKDINAIEYRVMYDKEPIAARVVNLLPRESWQFSPTVFETEDESETLFERTWKDLNHSLLGQSWLSQEEAEGGNPIYHYLQRADELSGIGHFGVILLGIDDGKELHEPVEGIDEKGMKVGNVNYNLTFIRPFDEALVDITNFEEDLTNPRYGQPKTYNITLADPKLQPAESSSHTTSQTKAVHWTRVIHLADNRGTSEVFGIPRMRQAFNRLYDLRKLYGGSAEMFWRGAFMGMSMETQPGEVFDPNTRVPGSTTGKTMGDHIKEQMRAYMNGLQRYLLTTGMTAKPLAPQVSDPANHIDAQITAISVLLGVPKRVFMGSERGELASNQDDRTWNDRLRFRQQNYITPMVIRPFVDRLIMFGILPEPELGYKISWPDLNALTKKEQAELGKLRTESVIKYVASGSNTLIGERAFLTNFIGFTPEEAEAMIEEGLENELQEEDNPDSGIEQPGSIGEDESIEGIEIGDSEQDQVEA